MRIFQKGFNFSQDGPGNRLVYHLQGCNLHCPWCSNPEGLAFDGGREYTMDQIVEEVLRSSLMFFDGGGVTLTGGEVTLQFDAVKELLTRLHEKGIHTCIETNGISPRLPELFPVLDLLIMDIKHHDPEIHKAVTGASNALTVENIRQAIAAGQALALRIPLIGGFNAELADAEAFARLLSGLGGGFTVELLTYHEYGKDKYKSLGLEYTMGPEAKISRDRLSAYTEILKASGLSLIKT